MRRGEILIWGAENKKIYFFLLKKDLLAWGGWSVDSREFIEKTEKGIDVEYFFKDYLKKVAELNDWYKESVIGQYIDQYSEFLKYKNILEGIRQYYSLNFIVGTAINWKVTNPYRYLDKHLTRNQLEVINSLPRNSMEQVDKIISFVDTYDMCDDAFRRNLYKLFNVKI